MSTEQFKGMDEKTIMHLKDLTCPSCIQYYSTLLKEFQQKHSSTLGDK